MKKLEVRFTRAPFDERVIGTLAQQDHHVYFEYHPDFLARPLWLSPFKLPPEPGLKEHRERDFGPLFGLFDDSLPDGWGLLLMDRFFRRQGSMFAEVSALDRLAFLGTRTMGALTYHPPSDPRDASPAAIDLHTLARASREVLQGRAADVLPELLRAGGSPGGARPKVLVGVKAGGDEILSGEDDLPPDYTHWLVKFHGRGDPTEMGAIELAYARMAGDSGIVMPPTQLFEISTGERFFGVERFDRHGNRRFHVHTFGNLIHADFRVPSCDYHQLLEVTRVLTRNHCDVLQCFRRMVFNVATHNRDDHVKNFAFRLNDADEWELAPAYDLVFAEGPGGEHTMSLAGEGRSPRRRHLSELARDASISEGEVDDICSQVDEAVRKWPDHVRDLKIGSSNARRIGEALSTCRARIFSRKTDAR